MPIVNLTSTTEIKKVIKIHIKKSTGPDSVLGSCVIDVLLHPHDTLRKINLHKQLCSKKEYPQDHP